MPMMPRSSKVAIPLETVAVVAPTSVAPALTDAVTTVELSLVTTVLPASCNDTCGCVLNAAPTTGPTGARTDTTLVGSDVTTIALLAPNEPDVPGDARVSVAALPTSSTMTPPFNASALVDA